MSKYVELAKKIKALAENGIDGEKKNAEKLLNDIMLKHNISAEDLEDEKIDFYYFDIPTDKYALELQTLAQITGILKLKLYGKFPKNRIKTLGLGGNYAIQCSSIKYLEVKAMFDFYCNSLDKRISEFFYAFCIKNNLLVPAGAEDKSAKDLSNDERELIINAQKLSENLSKDNYYKQIE